jgi:hypothetical protein
VISHLYALIPGQRTAKFDRQLEDLAREGRAHVLSGAAVRQVEEDDIAARALHQRPDRRACPLSDDEIAFPMPWNSAIFDLWWAIADQDHVPEPAGTGLFSPQMWTSLRPSRPEAGRKLLA